MTAWNCGECNTCITGFTYCPICNPTPPKVVGISEILKKLEDIVCTDGCDTGVVMLSEEGPCHREIDAAGKAMSVYDHAFFSPLGDALIDVYRSLQQLQDTPASGPNGGPPKGPQPPTQTHQQTWADYFGDCEISMENCTAEFLKAAYDAHGEWHQDIGSVAVTQFLLERDPDKIHNMIRSIFLDAWMLGNLADRVESSKVDSGVKPIIPE